MEQMQQNTFIDRVWGHYHEHGRALPWRDTTDPYKIMVSEIMLQQTQAQRVVSKYSQFLQRFPDIEALARAPLPDVLQQWQGLGYNRRGRWLQQAARELHRKPLPWSVDDLVAQKGIGYNTAAAIVVYAYNTPLVFIETNVRAVFIHHFFPQEMVDDRDLAPLIEQTLDKQNPREWYWALMDYGVYIKKHHHNPSRRSRHHSRQSRFEGSLRQLRAGILREVLAAGQLSVDDIIRLFDDPRVEQALASLVADELLQKHEQFYLIPPS